MPRPTKCYPCCHNGQTAIHKNSNGIRVGEQGNGRQRYSLFSVCLSKCERKVECRASIVDLALQMIVKGKKRVDPYRGVICSRMNQKKWNEE